MRYRLSKLPSYAAIPADATESDIRNVLEKAGLDVVEVLDPARCAEGPLVVGRVLAIEELTGFKKPVRLSQVDVGDAEPRSIVCAARNFAVGDLVVVALPGTVLAPGFTVAERKTYGVMSHGMMCSARELQLGDDHSTIVVLGGAELAPGDDPRRTALFTELTVDLATPPAVDR
jgi:phenylalanyl-tRNA synthetase beta chain